MTPQLDLLLLVADTVAVLADDAGKTVDAVHIRALMAQAEEATEKISAVRQDQRADLIADLAAVMEDRNSPDVTSEDFAAAVVAYLEKHGLLREEPAP